MQQMMTELLSTVESLAYTDRAAVDLDTLDELMVCTLEYVNMSSTAPGSRLAVDRLW